MTTKALDWKHEQEVRLFLYYPSPIESNSRASKPLMSSNPDYLRYSIDNECFKSIYLGLNIDKEKRNVIIRNAFLCNPNIKIYEMCMDPYALKLKERQIEIQY